MSFLLNKLPLKGSEATYGPTARVYPCSCETGTCIKSQDAYSLQRELRAEMSYGLPISLQLKVATTFIECGLQRDERLKNEAFLQLKFEIF